MKLSCKQDQVCIWKPIINPFNTDQILIGRVRLEFIEEIMESGYDDFPSCTGNMNAESLCFNGAAETEDDSSHAEFFSFRVYH